MMFLNLYLGGGNEKQKPLVFIYFCMMSCLLKIFKECSFSVYDNVFRLGVSAMTSCLLAWYLSQYSLSPRKAGFFQLLRDCLRTCILKPPTRIAIKQIQTLEQPIFQTYGQFCDSQFWFCSYKPPQIYCEVKCLNSLHFNWRGNNFLWMRGCG